MTDKEKKARGDTFRQCAATMVFRPQRFCNNEGCWTEYQFLLVHKPRKRDDWQLPQGGVEEGETVEEAALRELHEEAGVKASSLGPSGRSYQYTFPSSYRRYRPDHVCGQIVQFIFAMLEPGERVKVDQREIDRHAWVRADQLPEFLKRKAYLEVVQQLAEQSTDILANLEDTKPPSS